MSEIIYIIRKDVATRDLAGRSVIIAGNMQFDAPNNRILIGNDIILNGVTGQITVGSGANQIIINGPSSRIEVGTTNLKLEGANRRVLINDGTDDRILMGYQSGGF